MRYHCGDRCRSGKGGEQPYNSAANDVPLTQLIMRTRPVSAAPATGSPPCKQPRAVIDHIAHTVAHESRDRYKSF
jgi:hypothetical protein